MSDKSPHWPGADGKPGVSFGPKSLPESEDVKTDAPDEAKKDSATPRLDAAAAREHATEKTAQGTTVKDHPGQELAVPGQNTKQVSRIGGKARQGGKKPAGPKGAPQALPEAGAGAEQDGKPAQRTPRPMPHQARAALPGSRTGKPASQGAGAAAGSAGTAAAASAKAAPWSAAPAAGASSTARDKSHKPEGRLSKVGEVRRTRKARLRISRIDPWSVMKTTFLFSIAFGIMLVIIVAVLWAVVAGSGALQSINSTMTQLIGDSGTKFNIEDYINAGRVIGLSAVLAALNVVIITAVSTLFAFLYNLAAAVIGGLEVTLAED